MTIQETENKVDKQQVELRVADWKKRVTELYSEINNWLKNTDYTLRLGSKLTMNEELMLQFGVPKTEVETADIYNKDKKIILTIKPKGLWIIGANGRIDILSVKGNYLLVDFAKQFEEPRWKLFKDTKKDGLEFNHQEFLTLLK